MPPKKSLNLNRLKHSVEKCDSSMKQFTISKFFAKSATTPMPNKAVTIVIDETEDEKKTITKEKKVCWAFKPVRMIVVLMCRQ